MNRYAQVVVDVAPAHLDRPFDYLIPDGWDVRAGSRVRVVFAGRRRDGWVVATSDRTDAEPAKVVALLGVAGPLEWFGSDDLALYRWVADRYAGTLASVLRHALPRPVTHVDREAAAWPVATSRAAADRPPCSSTAWRPYSASRLLKAADGGAQPGSGPAFLLRPLVGDDPGVLVADLVARCLAAGRRALVLVPDPATSAADAVLATAGGGGLDLRAAESPARRYRAFLRTLLGHADVVVGERGAVLQPLPDLGLLVVVDEANPAYKERRAPRHHAREVALARARAVGATAVLVGDVPSAAAWRLVAAGHLDVVRPDRAAERARAPRVDLIDRATVPGPRARLTQRTNAALAKVVAAGGAAVVLAARGGQGAALACRRCGRRRDCPVCAASLRHPRRQPGGEDPNAWACAVCGWQGPVEPCPDCGETATVALAAGAGRLAQELAKAHPSAEVARMEGFDAAGPAARPAIAVLTRGSVVTQPRWLGGAAADLVVVPDADAFLARPSLDAAEDALRLWTAIGRWTQALILETAQPSHPALQALVRWDPDGFWQAEAGRRAELRYPPAGSLIRFSAAADDVVGELRRALPATDEILGPDLSGNVVVKTPDLRATLARLRPVRHRWGAVDRKIRIDVDPL